MPLPPSSVPVCDIITTPCSVKLQPLDSILTESNSLPKRTYYDIVKNLIGGLIESVRSSGVSMEKVLRVKKENINYAESENEDTDIGTYPKRRKKDDESYSGGESSDESENEYNDIGTYPKRRKKDDENNELSPYEQMIMKNRLEKMAFLESLKINEAKSSFVDAVSKIKKPKPVKKTHKVHKPPPTPVVQRKSKRLANVNIDLSEEAIFARSFEVIKAEEEKKEIPPNLPFKEALQFEDLYESFNKDVIFKDRMDTDRAPVAYKGYDFKKLMLGDNTVAKVVPAKITAIDFHSSVENIIISAASKYGHIGIWNVTSESSPYVFQPHSEGVTNLQFNPENSQQFTSSSWDGTLRCADIENKIFKEVYNVSHNTSCTYFDYLSPVTFLVAQKNGKVAVVDVRSEGKRGEKQHTCHDCPIKCIDVHPVNRSYFVTAENRGSVRLWDLRKLQTKPLADITHHKRSVTSAYFSPVSGKYILTAGMDDKLSIFDSSVLSENIKLKKSINHNNQTGRWLSTFRARWFPNTDDVFTVGSMSFPRRIEIFSSNLVKIHDILDDNLTITSINKAHSFKPALAGGNSSGKVFVFMEKPL